MNAKDPVKTKMNAVKSKPSKTTSSVKQPYVSNDEMMNGSEQDVTHPSYYGPGLTK